MSRNQLQQGLLRKVRQYDSIVAFMETLKGDPALSQRIVGLLPHPIHQVYLHEKEN
jgi:hypothetical protein